MPVTGEATPSTGYIVQPDPNPPTVRITQYKGKKMQSLNTIWNIDGVTINFTQHRRPDHEFLQRIMCWSNLQLACYIQREMEVALRMNTWGEQGVNTRSKITLSITKHVFCTTVGLAYFKQRSGRHPKKKEVSCKNLKHVVVPGVADGDPSTYSWETCNKQTSVSCIQCSMFYNHDFFPVCDDCRKDNIHAQMPAALHTYEFYRKDTVQPPKPNVAQGGAHGADEDEEEEDE